ncbi:hypothetical protein HBN50_13830 [Halobacteriovorax sp. GB3]|uniref:hypothetical protein n=1 Tax=Halobacteriovorax sp. GB3 TaxID=2719615 RepID=UPI00235F40AC|nr:hypothetical protein [Halobacteriovorax sp. GB3]MDD0854187.1 hypothetical protein [Halobacteriovorax sp. GB3]
MSVFFPLHGEEDIEISLDPKKQFVKGSFPATIKKLSGSEKKKAMIFLKELNSFIRLLQSPKLAICKESDSCTFENKVYVLSQDKKSFALSRSLALGKFEVKLENLNATHAEKIDIKYFDSNQDWRSSLRLELLMSKCYAQ